MAQVAAAGSLPSDSIHLRGVGPVLKRKTPSELRGEQLKRKTSAEVVDDSSSALRNLNWVGCPPKNTKYVEMRLDEVFQAKKPSSRFKLPSGKSTAKIVVKRLTLQEGVLAVGINGIKRCTVPSNLGSEAQQDALSQNASAASHAEPPCSATIKSGENRFRSVTELSLGNEKVDSGNVDVDKALKGLGSRDPSGGHTLVDSLGRFDDSKPTPSRNILSDFNVVGNKVPLDFTLKTNLRILSSSPNTCRFHRLLMGDTYTGTLQPPTQKNSYMLHSWVYPQSSLTPSGISALSSAGEVDFLTKRQLAWEESFRNLYYMLRKKHCDIFYVYTSNFVAMFTASGGAGENKRKCNAYVSQSTRGLRSLLSEHDVPFSMPLNSSTEEQISRDDLVELSEIERHNLGQTKRVIFMSDVDNTPQSLLSFSGNESVHGLYDFLLNYKSFLTLLTGMDVPMLYSPVLFQNASLQAPELKCKEIKTADHYAAALQQDTSRKDNGTNLDTSGGITYSIEAKDACLPPWIISSICGAMVSAKIDFEASFTTDLNSAGLNIVLQDFDNQCNESPDTTEKDVQRNNHTFGIPFTVVAPELQCDSLKSLKYQNGCYTVSIHPI